MEITSTVHIPGAPDLDPEVIRQYVTLNYNLKDGDTVTVTKVESLRSFKAEIQWATR